MILLVLRQVGTLVLIFVGSCLIASHLQKGAGGFGALGMILILLAGYIRGYSL